MKKSKKENKDKKLWGENALRKVIEKLDITENGYCFQTFLSLYFSKIERNCTLAYTDINLQSVYYIL